MANFWPKNIIFIQRKQQFWNILKKNELATNVVFKHDLISHIYSSFFVYYSIWFLVIFVITVSFDIVVSLVFTSTIHTTTEFTACQLLFAARASIVLHLEAAANSLHSFYASFKVAFLLLLMLLLLLFAAKRWCFQLSITNWLYFLCPLWLQ